MAYPKYILTGKTPATTYENLVQFNYESSSLVNGDGNDITASLILHVNSASWAATSVSASYAPPTVGLTATKSFVANTVTQSVYIQNGLIVNWTP